MNGTARVAVLSQTAFPVFVIGMYRGDPVTSQLSPRKSPCKRTSRPSILRSTSRQQNPRFASISRTPRRRKQRRKQRRGRSNRNLCVAAKRLHSRWSTAPPVSELASWRPARVSRQLRRPLRRGSPAAWLEVSEATLHRWKHTHPDFCEHVAPDTTALRSRLHPSRKQAHRDRDDRAVKCRENGGEECGVVVSCSRAIFSQSNLSPQGAPCHVGNH